MRQEDPNASARRRRAPAEPLLQRLRRAAARWLRWRLPGAPDAAGELLRRADAHPGVDLGKLVRGFAADARQLARRTPPAPGS